VHSQSLASIQAHAVRLAHTQEMARAEALSRSLDHSRAHLALQAEQLRALRDARERLDHAAAGQEEKQSYGFGHGTAGSHSGLDPSHGGAVDSSALSGHIRAQLDSNRLLLQSFADQGAQHPAAFQGQHQHQQSDGDQRSGAAEQSAAAAAMAAAAADREAVAAESEAAAASAAASADDEKQSRGGGVRGARAFGRPARPAHSAPDRSARAFASLPPALMAGPSAVTATGTVTATPDHPRPALLAMGDLASPSPAAASVTGGKTLSRLQAAIAGSSRRPAAVSAAAATTVPGAAPLSPLAESASRNLQHSFTSPTRGQ
jgi:hypothetical protein